MATSANSKGSTAAKRPTRKPPPVDTNGGHDEDLILDLRDLVATQHVMLSSGTYAMRRLTALNALERAEMEDAQIQAGRAVEEMEGLDDDADPDRMRELQHILTECNDRVLALALPETDRAERDAITQAESAGVMSAFFGAADDAAREMTVAVMRMQADAMGVTGERSSRGSSGSTRARRKSS